MFCGNCGTQLRDDDRFCPNCGAKTRIGQQSEDIPAQEPTTEQVPQPQAQEAKPETEQPNASVPEESPTKEASVEEAHPSTSTPGDQQTGNQPLSSSLINGAARLASAVDAMKDAFVGESIHCSTCGARLKAGAKFCPECGTPTGMSGKEDQQNKATEPLSAKLGQWKEKANQWAEQQNQAGQAQGAEQEEPGTSGDAYTAEAQGTVPTGKAGKPKKKWSKKKTVIVGVVVALIFIFIALPNSSSIKRGASDDIIIKCAQNEVAKILKSASTALWGTAQILDQDEYERYLVYVPLEAQNGFGGYSKLYYLVIVSGVTEDGHYWTTYSSRLEIPNFTGASVPMTVQNYMDGEITSNVQSFMEDNDWGIAPDDTD